MTADIEQELIEKVRALPLEKQKRVLSYAEELRQQNGGEGSRVEDLTIWEMVKEVILEVPAEAWEELPKHGSRKLTIIFTELRSASHESDLRRCLRGLIEPGHGVDR